MAMQFETLSKEELVAAIRNANSVSDVLRNLNRGISSGNYAALRLQAKALNVVLPDGSKAQNLKAFNEARRLTDEEFFVKGCIRAGAKLRRRMIKKGVPYSCSNPACRDYKIVNPIVAGLPLVLQVDHQDGDRLNNSFENLRFLCPNCHSQTETYGGKSKGKKT